jgi:trans-2,3-dihydro-3-hydroxyanthranilate isomerase
MMHRYVIADVFTDVPLEGNQLAVFVDAPDLDEQLMQRVARELNLSETVFVTARRESAADIRIFTPVTELAFAGHPVLGTAFVLGADTGAATVRLRTPGADVAVKLTRDGGQISYGEMEQPVPSMRPFPDTDELLEALGVERSWLPVEIYRNGPEHVYITLGSEDEVRSLTPSLTPLQRLGPFGFSCFAKSGHRVKTRMFAPALGVAEDPATGSAAGPLAVHLARHGLIEFGEQIAIHQGEEIARPSLLYARAEGTPERIERVLVGGSAVVVARGEYRLS